jgi:segregation and condensation protein B
MKTDLTAAFEAVLFSSGESVSIDRFALAFEIEFDEVVKTMEKLEEQLENRGIKLIRLQNAYQLCSKSEYGVYIRKVADMRRKSPLSSAGMEVLAVVAYNQPVTKAFIEQVRGVDCSSTVTNLVEKGLIEEKGRLELPGRPLLYGTTKNFLRCFGISDIKELPPIERNKEVEMPVLAEQLSALGDLNEEETNNEE